MEKMDEVAGHDIFMPLYERYVMQPRFPDLEEVYRRLGLESNGRGVQFSTDFNGTELRKGIMGQR